MKPTVGQPFGLLEIMPDSLSCHMIAVMCLNQQCWGFLAFASNSYSIIFRCRKLVNHIESETSFNYKKVLKFQASLFPLYEC